MSLLPCYCEEMVPYCPRHSPDPGEGLGSDPRLPSEGSALYARGMTERRYVTASEEPNPERYALYRLCECPTCGGYGRVGKRVGRTLKGVRCETCRGEGRTRDLIATCGTPEALGVALVTLGREGEWEGCPIGILDTEGATGEKWIVRPWTPSARNVSDAARTLANSKKEKP